METLKPDQNNPRMIRPDLKCASNSAQLQIHNEIANNKQPMWNGADT